MLRGVFIGVDRYASDGINWLASAERDALALHALFVDTLGGKHELLTNEDATLAAVRASLARLEGAEPDDLVVIAFSGHGAATHHAVTYDTDPNDIEATALSLTELTEIFARIRARMVVCILDCCFSGGMGAKVLVSETRARAMESVGPLLDQLSGKGRLILTASAANEEAYENARLGHGLLTHHVIEALLGVPSVIDRDQIRVYRLLDHVVKAVIASSEELGSPQHPAVRGSLDGELLWPIFRRGDAYTRAFPGWDAQRATADVGSLERLGFPPAIVAAWRQDIPALNALQISAINDHGVLTGSNVLVSAPTSSGKTMVGELAAVHAALNGARSVFLLPMRALVNDKYERFTSVYGPLGIRTIRATGEIADDVPDLMRGRYDICLMTNEKFASLALAMPHLLQQIGVLVVDEAQMIADPGRGVALEFLLTMIRARAGHSATPQVILLSAVIGDSNGLDGWLGGTLLRSTTRPVPLDEGVITPGGDFRYIDASGAMQLERGFIRPAFGSGSARAWIIPLLDRLLAEGEQVIVFRETRGEARATARYLSSALGLPPAISALDRLQTGDPSQASASLREALRSGVAFHVSDLDRDERRVVEETFRAKPTDLRVIAATTTLAMGINTPATAVIIAGLEHPQGAGASVPYTVAEYKNMAGRAGRLGYAPKGRSFVIAENPANENNVWRRYVLGSPEAITSHFPIAGQDPASVITRVLASGGAEDGMTAQEVIDFIALSFGAYIQAQRSGASALDRRPFETALSQLSANGLVSSGSNGRFRLTELGRLSGESGTHVGSILRLASVLRQVPPAALNDVALVAATQLTLELDEQFIPINRKSVRQEATVWLAELERQRVPYPIINGIRSWTNDAWVPTIRAKRTSVCLLWMSNTPFERIERTLAQFGGFDPGGPARAIIARTGDLLPTTIRVAEIIHNDSTLSRRALGLQLRLELGLPAAALSLAARVGSILNRRDYLTLLGQGVATVEAVEAATDEVVRACLGGSQQRVTALRQALLASRARLTEALAVPIYEGESS